MLFTEAWLRPMPIACTCAAMALRAASAGGTIPCAGARLLASNFQPYLRWWEGFVVGSS